MLKRLKLSLKPSPAIEVTRVAIGNQKLVYVLIANKKFAYAHGKKSAVAYIGTTKNGVTRVAGSAAERAEEILGLHGVTSVSARILTCKPRKNVKTWRKLERALLLAFRAEYGSVPKCNSHGKHMVETDEFAYFSRDAVRRIVGKLA
jgi:hypothetical protein